MGQDGTRDADERGEDTQGDPASPANEVDPKEFLRALLRINADDAERVRNDSSASRRHPEDQEGPVHDYGED
jgi:hypothetical protein